MRHLGEVIREKAYIRRLHGYISSRNAHGYAYIRLGQSRAIVHPLANKCHFASLGLQLLYYLDLLLRNLLEK